MRHGAVTELRRGANLAKQQALKRLRSRREVGHVRESRLDSLLDDHASASRTVFVHVGLSDIKSAFETNPYEFLLPKLERRFESIVAPGFTDYFKMSGVYHKEYSRPKHGMFSRLFLEDADYRTDDAIKSVLVKGPYRFDDCVHRDSYHEDGVFAKLVDDALVMDIGTPWIKCSHLHYFERQFGADYVTEKTYPGVMFADGDRYEVEQTCHRYDSPYYAWNRPRIERVLERRGVLTRYDLNGLKVLFFRLKEMEPVVGDMLQDDGLGLVKV